MLSHCKDVDVLIMKLLDGKDLINLMRTCKYFYNLPSDVFWKEKVKNKIFIKFKEIFEKITWKECYIIENIPNAYWLSAYYSHKNRGEMLLLLEQVRKISNVKPIIKKNENGITILKYYTRDGTKNGVKEGKYISWNDFGRKIYVSNYRNGKKNGKTKEFYVNRFNEYVKLFEKEFKNGKVISKTIYKNGKVKLGFPTFYF